MEGLRSVGFMGNCESWIWAYWKMQRIGNFSEFLGQWNVGDPLNRYKDEDEWEEI